MLPSISLISERLQAIFPEGTENRNYVTREMAARAIYVMFYTTAIEGTDRWIRPSQITGMSDIQSDLIDYESREAWTLKSLTQKNWRPADAWYAENSREPVRDETLRNGLVPFRAVVERPGIATTSSKPKYALEKEFSELFDQALVGEALTKAIASWQSTHLSKTAMSRLLLVKRGAKISSDAVAVRLPNGELRSLSPGPSSVITKSVIEEFSARFLVEPIVLWLSESGRKVVTQDDALARELRLTIDSSKALPDIILVDLGSDPAGSEMLVMFVEVVATDGPINRERKNSLTKLAKEAGFDENHLAFLTAFSDRSSSAFRKCIADLALNSYAWCASEPDNIIEFRERGTASPLNREGI